MTKKKAKTIFHALVALCALCHLTGCQTISDWFEEPRVFDARGWAPALPDGVETTESPARPIQARDKVIVSIRAGTNFTQDGAFIVDEFGKIPLLHIGDFKVATMMATEAGPAIRDEYVRRGILVDPTVTVILDDDGGPPKMIFFIGEIRGNERVTKHFDGLTLRQAITIVGGTTQYASNTVKLTRYGRTTKHNLRRISNNKEYDPLLRPGDTIEVLPSWY